MSQFANDNKIFFEFYHKYCLVRDIPTKDILLQGDAEKVYISLNMSTVQALQLSKVPVIGVKI